MFLALGVMTLLEKLMPARETPTHLVASKSLKKGQAGYLQKPFRKTNVKKLKH